MPETQARIARETDQLAKPASEAATMVYNAWCRFAGLKWRKFRSNNPALATTECLVVDADKPSITTSRYSDGSHYIKINSGLVYYLHAVCQAATNGSAQQPFIEWHEIDQVLLTTFKQWKNDIHLSKQAKVQHETAAETIDDELFAWAIIFVVLTEYGRVALSGSNPVDDSLAIRWVAQIAGQLVPENASDLLVAGLLAIGSRTLWEADTPGGAIDSWPTVCSGIYAAEIRRSYCDDVSFFLENPSAFSLAIRVEVAARAARDGHAQLPMSPYLIVALIVAELLGVREGKTKERAAQAIEGITTNAGDELLKEVAELYGAVFSIEQPSYWKNRRARSLIDSFPAVIKWMSFKERERLTTQAQRDLYEKLENYPPGRGARSMGRAFALLSYRKWTAYKDKFPALRSTVMIVTNEAEPFAQAKQYADASTLICINEGLIYYIQAFCYSLATGFVTSSGGEEVPAALDPTSVDIALLHTYRQWQLQMRAGIAKPPDKPLLGGNAKSIADGFLLAAIQFNAMHEVGHAALHGGLKRNPATHELQADQWAIKALFDIFAKPTHQENRVLAGALLTLRAFAARERLPEFKVRLKEYPPSHLRFQQLIQEVQSFYPDEISFYMKTTVAFANDMRMESMENAQLGKKLRPPSRPEQFASTIVARLIDVMREQVKWKKEVKWKKVVENVDFILSQNQPEMIIATAQICQRIFSASQPSYKNDSYIPQLVRQYRSLLKRLPANSAEVLKRRNDNVSAGS